MANNGAEDSRGEHLLGVGREAKKHMVGRFLAQNVIDNRSVKNLRVP